MPTPEVEYPRMAVYDGAGFGLYRKDNQSPIQIAVREFNELRFFCKIEPEELRDFCRVMGLDCPYANLVEGRDE